MTLSIPLPAIPADESATADLPAEIAAGLAPFIDGFAECPDWQTRFDLAETAFRPLAVPTDRPSKAAAARGMLDTLLENLGERSIESLEAAALYRLSGHPSWRLAAIRFYEATPDETIHEFIGAHPTYRALAIALI